MIVAPLLALLVTSLAASVSAGGGDVSTNVIPASQVAYFTKHTRYAFVSYYNDGSSISNWSCNFCKDPSLKDTIQPVFTPSADGNSQGFVAISPSLKSIIVSLRGTNSAAEVVADLFVVPQNLPVKNSPEEVLVHAGFWYVWAEQLRPVVEPVLKKYIKANPGYTVSFVGHSLGGAAAVLAAVDLTARGVVQAGKSRLITFGQPRIGNAAFGAYVNSFHFAEVSRVVNYNDIVPHLPPYSDFYQQQSTEYWINASGKVVTCDDAAYGGEDSNCSNTVLDNLTLASHGKYFGLQCPRFEQS
ncbi:hypothetical protein HDU99_004915 [Rhizoclosmatium hyalinum]|nr:hypothetical protein HDU99_004915 [Rhizoclosmatium hyalinum]